VPYHAYLFEAKSIQQWIFAGGKLADMVAASDLLESLTGSLLEQVLNVLPDKNSIKFTRRAGGTFYASSDSRDSLLEMRSLWNAFVGQAAPGLQWSDALVGGETIREAVKAGILLLAEKNNQPVPVLPETTTMMLRAPRSGKSAVALDRRSPTPEWVDEDLQARREFKQQHNRKGRMSELEKKFTPLDLLDKAHWPTDLQGEGEEKAFPFRGEHDLLALIHADGNGLGQLLQKMDAVTAANPRGYEPIYRGFSEALSKATEAAAKDATAAVLAPNLQKDRFPARPLILGGDDLSIIVRGDLAIQFAESFLLAFEKRTSDELAALQLKLKQQNIALPDDFPKRLFACAGIAFIKPKQPFYLAYTLCEALCAEAKKAVSGKSGLCRGEKRSALSFYRLMQTTAENPIDMVNRETLYAKARTGIDAEIGFRLGAYGMDAGQGLPCLTDLRQLKNQVGKYQSWLTRIRETLTLAEIDPVQARRQLRRWAEMTEKRSDLHNESSQENKDWQGFMAGLENLVKPLMKEYDKTSQTVGEGSAQLDPQWQPLVRTVSFDKKTTRLVAPFSEMMVLDTVEGEAR
jgi:hypothetical protein